MFLAYLQTAYIIYIGLAEPLKEKTDNLNEVVQEVAVMLCIYHLFMFTDWVSTVSAKASYDAGWTQSIIVILVIILGIFRMVRQAVTALKNKWRQIRYRKMMALSLQRQRDLIIKQAEIEAIKENLKLESIKSEPDSSIESELNSSQEQKS
jgi:hypothetical protein